LFSPHACSSCIQSETNQELIMAQGGIRLLSMTAGNAEDPQTLRMIAGAIANLCGNGKLLDPIDVYSAEFASCLHFKLV